MSGSTHDVSRPAPTAVPAPQSALQSRPFAAEPVTEVMMDSGLGTMRSQPWADPTPPPNIQPQVSGPHRLDRSPVPFSIFPPEVATVATPEDNPSASHQSSEANVGKLPPITPLVQRGIIPPAVASVDVALQRQCTTCKAEEQQRDDTLQRQPTVNRTEERVQRDDTPKPEPRKGLDASMLKVEVTKPVAYTGQMTVQKGTTSLKVQAPLVSFRASVSLAKDVTIDDKEGAILIGPVQTLTGSQRIGVYKKGDQVVAERANTLGPTRDARPYGYNDTQAKDAFAAEGPFYDNVGVPSGSKTIDGGENPCGDAATGSAITSQDSYVDMCFADRPSFSLPLEFATGKLSEVKGSDSFNTSIGAKRGGTLVLLNPFGWRVNWNTKLDDAGNAPVDPKETAKAIEIWKEAAGIAIDSPQFAMKASLDKAPSLSLKTVEAAKSLSVQELWFSLVQSRGWDPESAKNIEEALRQKNPSFTVAIAAQQSATDEDMLEAFASGSKQSSTQGGLLMKKGAKQTLQFSLKDILDPASVQAGSTLSIWIGGNGEKGIIGWKHEPILGEFAEFAYPFVGQKKAVTVSTAERKQGIYQIEIAGIA